MDKDMFLVYQAPTKPLSSYLSKFKGAVDIVELSDRSQWSHPAATKVVYNNLYGPRNYTADKNNSSNDYQAASTEAQMQYLSVLFFHGLSNNAHRDLKKNITTTP